MSKKIKRRLFPVVDRSHQYRFLALILIYNMIIVAFLVAALFVPDFIQLHDKNLSLESRAFVADKILTTHTRIWPAIMALICVIGLHSFRTFHRFFGALYRFHWAFQQIRNGNLSFRVNLRKKDYLQNEKDTLNEMIEMLAEKIMGVQRAGQQALQSLDELGQKINKEGDWSKTNKEFMRLHRQHLDTLMDTTQYFRLPKDEQAPGGPET